MRITMATRGRVHLLITIILLVQLASSSITNPLEEHHRHHRRRHHLTWSEVTGHYPDSTPPADGRRDADRRQLPDSTSPYSYPRATGAWYETGGSSPVPPADPVGAPWSASTVAVRLLPLPHPHSDTLRHRRHRQNDARGQTSSFTWSTEEHNLSTHPQEEVEEEPTAAPVTAAEAAAFLLQGGQQNHSGPFSSGSPSSSGGSSSLNSVVVGESAVRHHHHHLLSSSRPQLYLHQNQKQRRRASSSRVPTNPDQPHQPRPPRDQSPEVASLLQAPPPGGDNSDNASSWAETDTAPGEEGTGEVTGGGTGVQGTVAAVVSYSEQVEYGGNRSMAGGEQVNEAQTRLREECEERIRSTPYPTDGGIYCNRTFDGWGCFNDTPAGSRAFTPCPSFKKGFDSGLFGYKDCMLDGTWWRHPNTNKTWTNYTTCVNTKALQADTRTLYIFFAGYSISMVALLASLFIFYYFRQLQCDRVTIHKNLFISYILNGISWLLYYSLAAMSGDTMMQNPVWCQALHVVTQYLVACNFFWMFCEGLYLHTIIVSAFTTGKKLIIACYIIGWCSPIVTTIIYTALRAHHPSRNKRCWLDETPLQYIVVGPIVITIALNLAFLCNIVRVLITKLRAVNSPDTNQTRKAVRATLILIPLLGLQYILFPFRPDKGTPLHEVYSYVSAFVTSFQGLFVALIFCFCNGEVMSVMKRKWGQHRLMHGNANGRTGMYTQTTCTMAENTQAPKSPRLYDNRSQAPGGKPNKNGPGGKMFKMRLGRGRSMEPVNSDEDVMENDQQDVKCTSAV